MIGFEQATFVEICKGQRAQKVKDLLSQRLVAGFKCLRESFSKYLVAG